MTYRTNALAGALACIVLATGSPALAGSITAEELIGTWDWTQTLTFRQGILTPETEGYTLVLVMRGDGTYDLLRDGVPDRSGAWELTDETSACGSPQSLWIENLISSGSWVNLDQNELIFGMLCLDLPDYYFQRRGGVGAQATSWSMVKVSAGQPGGH